MDAGGAKGRDLGRDLIIKGLRGSFKVLGHLHVLRSGVWSVLHEGSRYMLCVCVCGGVQLNSWKEIHQRVNAIVLNKDDTGLRRGNRSRNMGNIKLQGHSIE